MLKQSDKIELFDHYEANLGKMTSSSALKGVSEQEFLVFIYEGQPYEDCTTYVTVGVSDHPLHSRRSHCFAARIPGQVSRSRRGDGPRLLFCGVYNGANRETLRRRLSHGKPSGASV